MIKRTHPLSTPEYTKKYKASIKAVCQNSCSNKLRTPEVVKAFVGVNVIYF